MPAAQSLVARLQSVSDHIENRTNVAPSPKPRRNGRPHLLENALHVFVVGAQHRETVERQVGSEIHEALLEPLRSRVVRGEVVIVDVCDDGDIGCSCMNARPLYRPVDFR